MKMESDITDYRAMLALKLGSENFEKYLEALRDLFGRKLTKETFDNIVSPYLTGDALVLHNLMILGILKKCDTEAKTFPMVEDNNYNYVPVESESKSESISDDKSEENSPTIVPIIVIRAKPGEEIDFPLPDLNKRFSTRFVEKFHKISSEEKGPAHFIPNVTHLYDIEERIDENSTDKTYFPTPENGQPYTSYKSPYYGKCFLKAWNLGCSKIDIDAIDTAADFTYNHIRDIISAMVRQKKPFRRHLPKVNTTYSLIGESYPNPYLNQGYHSYENFSRPEIISCGESMHVPDHISSFDERERLGVLRMAANCPVPEPSPYDRKCLTVAELLAVLKDNPRLVPNAKQRSKMMTKILEKLNCASRINSPIVEKRNVFYPTFDIEELEEEEGELMPSCSY